MAKVSANLPRTNLSWPLWGRRDPMAPNAPAWSFLHGPLHERRRLAGRHGQGHGLGPPHGTVVVRFVADNPGVWMVHCHQLHHPAGGMDFLVVKLRKGRRIAGVIQPAAHRRSPTFAPGEQRRQGTRGMPDYGHSLLFGTFLTPVNGPAQQPVDLAVLGEELGFDLVTFQDHPYRPTEVSPRYQRWCRLDPPEWLARGIRSTSTLMDRPTPCRRLGRSAAWSTAVA
jgi:hypothetical protein